MKPKLFIGSSREGKRVASAIQQELEQDAEATIWDQGVFNLSNNYLQDLLAALDDYDFAVFVFTPDDIAEIRDEQNVIPRDNVVFETGLFMGRLGAKRVYFVKPRECDDFHLLSDLSGISYGEYDANRDNLRAALGPFCTQVRNNLEKFQKPAPMPVLNHFKKRILEKKDPDFLVHTFLGLRPETSATCVEDYSAIYYLWADADNDSITLSIEKEGEELQYYCIRFHNAKGTHPSNVAFRPCGTMALDNLSQQPGPNNAGKGNLRFFARLPLKRELTDKPVAMSFRVIDKFGTHWGWQTGSETYIIKLVDSKDWKPVNIDLTSRDWRCFESDGNFRYARETPDFSMILAVVIEFGGYERDKRPGEGQGTVHLRSFELTD